jgi:hypothetical protein
MTDMKVKSQLLFEALKEKLKSVSQNTLEWISVVLIHCACIPSTLAFLRGVSDLMPSVEVVLFMWAGLIVYFFKSFVENNRMMMFTNAVAFFIQAMLLAMVVYK